MRPAALLFALSFGALAQTGHVKWTLEFSPAAAKPGSDIVGKLTAHIDPGWHLYSLSTPPPPIATTIQLADSAALEGMRVLQPKPIRKHDPNFDADTETFEGSPVFYLKLHVRKEAAAGAVDVTARPRYQVCSDTSCIPPKQFDIVGKFSVDPAATGMAEAIPGGYSEAKVGKAPSATDTDQSLGGFLAIAFGFGLAAIFTPCVFPMIPITMSFFLNQENATRRQTLTQAGLFCLGIIVLFAGMGLLTTWILGAVWRGATGK